MRKFFAEFKEFALRGNVLDLAVGVIIGGAFQSVVNSLTTNIISPLVGVFAKTDFNDLMFDFLGVSIKYGAFITSVINFIIMAFVIFVLVKIMNRIARLGHIKKEVKTKKCKYCLSEIPINAVRCPHCTSMLTDDNDNNSNINDLMYDDFIDKYQKK